MNKTSLNKIVLLIGLMAILISACGPQPTPVVPADRVTVQLSWFHGVEYAGFYTAVEKGYYKEENIEIVLNPGGPEINPIDEVQNGKAQFGITSGDSIIIAMAIKTLETTGTIIRDGMKIAKPFWTAVSN